MATEYTDHLWETEQDSHEHFAKDSYSYQQTEKQTILFSDTQLTRQLQIW